MKTALTQSKWFIVGGLFLTFLQFLFDTLNVAGIANTMWLGAIIMFGSMIYSGAKQFFDKSYDNITLIIQLCLFFAYVGGGILDNLDMLPFTEEGKSIIRTALTAINGFIPIIIKTIQQMPNASDEPQQLGGTNPPQKDEKP